MKVTRRSGIDRLVKWKSEYVRSFVGTTYREFRKCSDKIRVVQHVYTIELSPPLSLRTIGSFSFSTMLALAACPFAPRTG